MEFRTIEFSAPEYEFDGLRWATVKSAALKTRADVTLFVPPGCENQKLPVLVLMHGVYGSHWAWALKGGAHRTATQLIKEKKIRPLVIAMPSDGLWGDGSGYVPHAAANYESWIMDEVPQIAAQACPQADPAQLYLSGLSMGGFGALRLGGKFAPRVKGISAHSSATKLEYLQKAVAEDLSVFQKLPATDREAGAALIANKKALPPLRFDCGTEDHLIEHNRTLHKELSAAGVAHTYEEFPGAHTWEYWQTHIRDTLLFVERCRKA